MSCALEYIHKSNPMEKVMQKIRPAFHTFQNASFPFCPSSISIPQTSETYRTSASDFMGVKFIADKCPGGLGICTDQCFHGFYEIFFRPCGIQIGDFHTTGCNSNIKESDQTCCAMEDRFKLYFCTLPRERQHPNKKRMP